VVRQNCTNLLDISVFANFKPERCRLLHQLGTFSVAYISFLAVYKTSVWGINWHGPIIDGSYAWEIHQFSPSFPDLMAMLSLAFFIHSAVITLLKSNEKPENNTRDLSLGYLLVGLTYAGIGSLFFLSFPDNKECIGQNVLENLKKTDGFAIIARFFLFLQMGTVFPLLIFIFRVQFLYVVFKVRDYPGFLYVLLLNGVTITLCTIVAIVYPNVADIIGWSGAICGLVYIFCLPCIVSVMIKRQNGTITPKYYILHGSLIALGVAILIMKIVVAFSDN